MFGLLPTTPNDQGQSADREEGQRGRLRDNDARGESSQILEALGIVQEPRTERQIDDISHKRRIDGKHGRKTAAVGTIEKPVV